MKTRMVVVSDTHLGHFSKFSHTLPSGHNSRLTRCVEALKEVFHQATADDYFLFLGDLFDDGRHIRPEMLLPLYEAFEELKVPKERRIFIPGQHDFSSAGGLFHSIQILKPFVTVLDTVAPYETDEFVFRYFLMRNQEAGVVPKDVTKGKPEIILVHALIEEIFEHVGIPLLPDMISVKRDIRPLKKTAAIFCGDYHNHVFTTFGQKKKPLVSVGPLLPNSFSDEKSGGKGGFWVYEVDPQGDLGDYKTNFKPTSYTNTFVTVVDPDDFGEFEDPAAFYRVTFKGESDYLKFKQKWGDRYHVEPVLVSEQREVKKENRLDVTFDMDPASVVKRYCDFVGQPEMTKVGLEYLKRGVE